MELNHCLFKKQLEQERKITATHSVMFSVYIPPGQRIDEIRGQLQGHIDKRHDSSDLIARSIESTVAALNSHLDTLGAYGKGNGAALFFGEINGKMHRQSIEPPLPVPSFICKVEKTFYLDPLYDMIASEEAYGFIVIDLSETTLGYLKGSNLKKFASVSSQVPNKHHHGGMSSLRFERLRDDAINEYFKKISEKCSQAFLGQGLRGLIVAGPAKTKNDFMSTNLLHHELRKIVLGIVDTAHTDERGLKEAVASAEGYLSSCPYVQEKRALERFWNEMGRDGLEVSGLMSTTERLKQGRVEMLIMSESLDIDTIQNLKLLADQYDTEVMIIGEDEDYGEKFSEMIKVGGLLRYK